MRSGKARKLQKIIGGFTSRSSCDWSAVKLPSSFFFSRRKLEMQQSLYLSSVHCTTFRHRKLSFSDSTASIMGLLWSTLQKQTSVPKVRRVVRGRIKWSGHWEKPIFLYSGHGWKNHCRFFKGKVHYVTNLLADSITDLRTTHYLLVMWYDWGHILCPKAYCSNSSSNSMAVYLPQGGKGAGMIFGVGHEVTILGCWLP